jgi:hypothetical protein
MFVTPIQTPSEGVQRAQALCRGAVGDNVPHKTLQVQEVVLRFSPSPYPIDGLA